LAWCDAHFVRRGAVRRVCLADVAALRSTLRFARCASHTALRSTLRSAAGLTIDALRLKRFEDKLAEMHDDAEHKRLMATHKHEMQMLQRHIDAKKGARLSLTERLQVPRAGGWMGPSCVRAQVARIPGTRRFGGGGRVVFGCRRCGSRTPS
jgi:hypothetical protein